MSPHPLKELDMDRKEELIIAKQLRACRVNILPRNPDNCFRINSTSPSPSPRSPGPPSPYLNNIGRPTPTSDFVLELSSAMQSKNYKYPTKSEQSQNSHVKYNLKGIESPKILVSNDDEVGHISSPQTNEDRIETNLVQFYDNTNLSPGQKHRESVEDNKYNITRNLSMDPQHIIEKRTVKELQPVSKLPFLNDICALRKSPIDIYQHKDLRTDIFKPKSSESPTILVTDVDKLCSNSPEMKLLSPNKNRTTDLVQCEASRSFSQGQRDKENDVTKKGNLSKFFTMEDTKENDLDHDSDNIGNDIVSKPPSRLPFLSDIHALRKKSSPLPQFDQSTKLHNSSSNEGVVNQNVNRQVDLNVQRTRDERANNNVHSLNKSQISNRINGELVQKEEEFDNFPNVPGIQSQVKNCSEIDMLGPSGLPNKNNENTHLRPHSNSTVTDHSTNDNNKLEKSIDTQNVMMQKTDNNQQYMNSESCNPAVRNITDNQPHIEKDTIKANKGKTKAPNKYNIKLDDKSSMSRLVDTISPQLNLMQTNLLGLLLFSKLSSNVMEDLIRQQLSGLDPAKLTALILSLGQQVCDSMGPLLVGCMTEDNKTGLLCDLFGNLSNEEKAGILFTSGDNVLETCRTIADFGGTGFKKALIQNIAANEDKAFMDDIVYEYLSQEEENTGGNPSPKPSSKLQVHNGNSRHYSPADEESFNSCEESLIEDK